MKMAGLAVCSLLLTACTVPRGHTAPPTATITVSPQVIVSPGLVSGTAALCAPMISDAQARTAEVTITLADSTGRAIEQQVAIGAPWSFAFAAPAGDYVVSAPGQHGDPVRVHARSGATTHIVLNSYCK
jgi:hypothetical protein